MAPRKRRQNTSETIPDQTPGSPVVRQEERKRKRKFDVVDRDETVTEDRFSAAELRILLDAYNENGYLVFHNLNTLKNYFPKRDEKELQILIDRLRFKLAKPGVAANQTSEINNLSNWATLAVQSMNSLSRAKKINMDNTIPDTLMFMHDNETFQPSASNLARETESDNNSTDLKPNYNRILMNFAQLMVGKFPDDPSPVNAQVSRRLFDDLNDLVDSVDLDSINAYFADDTWIKDSLFTENRLQARAVEGLEKIDGKIKKCFTLRDLETDKDIEALCLELPKIRRITDVLNPLHVDKLITTKLKSLISDVTT